MSTLHSVLFVSAVLVACFAYIRAKDNHPPTNDWESYKLHHGKKYDNATHEKYHQAIHKKRAADVAQHNALFAKGLVTYDKELNRFADEDEATLKQRRGYLPLRRVRRSDDEGVLRLVSALAPAALPTSFDWRTKYAVSPVKDQGQCGSCWAFSATGALESQVYLKYKTTHLFSEQQLVDCDTYNKGCGGGNYQNAWSYIYQGGGIETESAYPFVSGTNQAKRACAYTSDNGVQKLSNYKVLAKNETLIQQYLVSIGPLSIAMDASRLSPYSSGIYNCPSNWSLDHAILLVGYGSDSTGKPYWILKNQWGTNWGLQGYFHLARGTNSCGINSDAGYPII